MTSNAPSLCCTPNATTNINVPANILSVLPPFHLPPLPRHPSSLLPPIYITQPLDFRHACISFLYRLRRKGASRVYALHISYSCKHLPSHPPPPPAAPSITRPNHPHHLSAQPWLNLNGCMVAYKTRGMSVQVGGGGLGGGGCDWVIFGWDEVGWLGYQVGCSFGRWFLDWGGGE